MATVEVSRKKLPHPVRDGVRSYKVICDEDAVGSLGMGESMTFDPGPGSHTLRIKIDFMKSKTIAFDLTEDGAARFECEPGGSYFAAFIDFFKPEGWVKLVRLDQPG